MIKPKALKPGDRIAIVSQSWGGPAAFPRIHESGLRNLRELGLETVEFPTARMDAAELYAHPELRALDITAAFADPDISGILSSIGGSDSVRILRDLDMDVIRKNPKFLMGYSDFSTLTTWLNLNGLVTFNGPSVMAGFSQLGAFPAEYRTYLSDFLLSPRAFGRLPVFPRYSEGYPDWKDPANTGCVKEPRENGGPRFIQGTGAVRGRLFGGCLEVLEMMKGTDFWPDRDFWNGRVLFLETSEEKPSVDYVRYCLRNFGVMGVFDRICGLLFGRARDYSDAERGELEEAILSVVRDEFGRPRLHVVCNLDFGHTDPQLILPLGIEFEIDADSRAVTQAEAAFV